MANVTLLETENIEVAFGGLVALKGVNFTIAQGELVGIIGPNGAGKTTFFNIISGLFKPRRGKIIFQGNDITSWKPDRRCRNGITRTFQLVRVFPAITVLQNVLVGVYFGRNGRRHGNAVEIGWQVLDEVGLKDRAYELAGQLNLAARKRLEIARALATEPQLLMFDEIIAGLNPTETEEMMLLIRSIRENGVTVLLIEHVMRVIMSLSDRVIVLHHGRKIADDVPSKVVENPTVISAYLGEN